MDAAVAAQAVICVVMPQAAGLGGDTMAVVRDHRGVHAVNGSGRSPRALVGTPATTGGSSVTVPGLVDGWLSLTQRWGRLPLRVVLSAAIDLASEGVPVDEELRSAVRTQHARLLVGGGGEWDLLATVDDHRAGRWVQPALAALLEDVAERGGPAFYTGRSGEAMVAAVRRAGGVLDNHDLSTHSTACPPPIRVPWAGGHAHVQPPASQGVLLAMALQKVAALAQAGIPVDDHVLVEVTTAAFGHRASCARGRALLDEELAVDLERASGRGGPRAYLHTAGVATVDADGQAVSSLVSVFDDFGSAVYVPELGIVLNNRAAGFTDGDNAPAPAKRPVHTLAPALLTTPEGGVLALATPGADGQVQTLLQVMAGVALGSGSLRDAVGARRWRSQAGDLLVEDGHPASADLEARGHRVLPTAPGDEAFGAVVAAGISDTTYAVADWRRQTSCAAVA
jgi:gamma-glutamyltranspeptidase/glutathione hydrolase